MGRKRKRSRRNVPLLVVGLLFVVVGTAVARWVGPDDTIELGTHTVPPEAAGLAVVTHPEVTAFRDLGMRVQVSAPGGVFLAASHRVDTDDLLGERERYEISEVSRSHVGGRINDAGSPATWAALRPHRTAGWAHVSPDVPVRGLTNPTATPRAVGEMPTRAELRLHLGEDGPVDFVAVPVDPSDRVTLSLGVFVDHLHSSQVNLARLGGLLLLWWVLKQVWRSVRARRDPPDAADPLTEGEQPSSVADPDAAPTGRATRRATAPVPVPAVPALGGLLLGLLLALAVSGCSLPSSTSSPRPAVHPLLSLDEAAGVSAAEPVRIHSPALTQYPLWAVVELPPRKGAGATHGRLQLLERRSFRSSWKPLATVRLDVEAPRPAARAATASAVPLADARLASDEVRAKRAADAVARFWTTGEPGKLDVRPETVRARRTVLRQGSGQLWVTGRQGSPRVVPVTSGSLALVQHTVQLPEQRTLTTALLLLEEGTVVLGSSLARP